MGRLLNGQRQRGTLMDNLKTTLFAHIEEQIDAASIQKRLRNNLLQPYDGSFGSHVLVNIPSQKERREAPRQIRQVNRRPSETGDTR
jgi:hypothetical protein